MAWETHIGGSWRSSDDLTVGELESIEAATGTPWSLINPFRSMPVARAMLATWLVRDGKTDDEAKAEVSALTAKTLKNAFRFVDEDDLPDDWTDGMPTVDPKTDAGVPSTSGSSGPPAAS